MFGVRAAQIAETSIADDAGLISAATQALDDLSDLFDLDGRDE
jgi:hypothetical protein